MFLGNVEGEGEAPAAAWIRRWNADISCRSNAALTTGNGREADGHRRAEKPSDNWGGLREKGSAPWVGDGEWLNADARMAQAQKFAQFEVNGSGTN